VDKFTEFMSRDLADHRLRARRVRRVPGRTAKAKTGGVATHIAALGNRIPAKTNTAKTSGGTSK